MRAGVDDDEIDDDDESSMAGLMLLVGVLGIEPLFRLADIGRVVVLNDVERVSIRLVPFVLMMLLLSSATRRFGGGDGGGNGTPG